MKATSLQLSFCASVAAHGLVFAIVAGGGFTFHKAEMPRHEGFTTVRVVAASPATTLDEIIPPEKSILHPLFNPQEAKPQFAKGETVEKRLEPIVQENQRIVPVKLEVESLPTVPPEQTKPTSKIAGDGSSVAPGEDETTSQTTVVGARKKPNYLKNQEPSYPLLARHRREEGLALLSVKVTAQGNVSRVALKKSSGFPLLDAAATKAVAQWQFEPARVGALAVESEIEVPVQFKLTR